MCPDPSAAYPSQQPRRQRILLVDDIPAIRLLLRAGLNSAGGLDVVAEASNGEEAVAIVRALAPDLVILDLEMPVMSGEQAIPLMRELEPRMPILLHTATPAKVETFPAAAAPDEVIEKGQPLDRLISASRSLLARGSFDVLRLSLGTVRLRHAVAAFDTWIDLNVRILEDLASGRQLALGAGSPTAEELHALVGLFVHLGSCLQAAAERGLEELELVVHTLRTTSVTPGAALWLSKAPEGPSSGRWGITEHPRTPSRHSTSCGNGSLRCCPSHEADLHSAAPPSG